MKSSKRFLVLGASLLGLLRAEPASAATIVLNVSSVSALYSAFTNADNGSNYLNTYEIHLSPRTYQLLRNTSTSDRGDQSSRTTGCLKLKYGHVVLIGAGSDENAASDFVISGGWNGTATPGTSLFCVGQLNSTFHPSLEIRGVMMQDAFSASAHPALDVIGADFRMSYSHIFHVQSQNTPGGALSAVLSSVSISNSYFDGATLFDYLTDTCGGVFATGGLLYLSGSSATISSSSFYGGRACRGAGIAFGGSSSGNTLTIQNSTIFQNEAKHRGGGLLVSGPGPISLFFNTIAENRAGESSLGDGSQESRYGGGIGFGAFTGTLRMKGNIIAKNVVVNQALNGVPGTNHGDDCFIAGAFSTSIDQYSNLVGKQGNCTFLPVGTLVGANTAPVDPKLGPSEHYMPMFWSGFLGMYTGFQPGSVAVGGFLNTFPNLCPGFDERLAVRPNASGLRCDIGSYDSTFDAP